MEASPGEKLIFNSIGFVNDPKLMDEFENYEPNLEPFASTKIVHTPIIELKTLKETTIAKASEFIGMDLEDQRKLFASKEREKKKLLELYLQSVCDIIRNIASEPKIVQYFILLLDGMIEGKKMMLIWIYYIDNRDRISILVGLQKATKGKEDFIGMLMQYAYSNSRLVAWLGRLRRLVRREM